MFLFLNFDQFLACRHFFSKIALVRVPPWKSENENCRMATFDSLKEASWCTDCNAENHNSFRWTIFKKMQLYCLISPKKLTLFFIFSQFFSKLIMFIGCLNAFMKCHDPLISIQQKQAMCYVPSWKKMGKTVKKVIFFWIFLTVKSHFFKNYPSKWALVFCVAISASRRFF